MLMVIDMAAAIAAPLPARWAALLHDLGKGTTPAEVLPKHIGHEMRSVDLARRVCERLRVPADSRDAALLAAREHGNIHRCMDFDAAALMRLLERCDALRRPTLLDHVLDACEADHRGRAGLQDRPYPQRARLRLALAAAQAVDAGAVVARLGGEKNGERIASAVHQARVAAVGAALSTEPAA
jgi:tRNA nucleotidyltransferase (CCA-adding enzyme)